MFTSIRQRFLFFFVGMTIIPTLLVGAVVSGQSYVVQQQQALALQREIALQVATQITGFMASLEDQLSQVGAVGDFARLDQDERATRLSQLLSYQNGLEELSLLDSEGQEQIRLNRLSLVSADDLLDYADSDEFQQPLATGETYYGPLFFDERTGEPLIRIAVPLVEARDGSTYAVLMGSARIKLIWDMLRALEVSEGEQVYVVAGDGQVIAHPLPSVVLAGTRFDLPPENGIYPGLTGEKVVLSSVPVQFGGYTYYVVAEQWESKALALAINTVFVTTVVTMIALWAAGTVGILAARQIVLPIESMAKAARAIEDGDLSVRTGRDSRDEIGTLSRAFDRMASRLSETLQGLEQQVVALQEAKQDVQELNTGLERRVAERTAELQAANERLTELDHLKSKFIADLSHELRTPIAVLSTRVYLLERGRPEKQAEYVQNLKEQVDLLTRFVNSVFELSRFDLGSEVIERKQVEINTLIDQTVSVLSPRAEAAGLTLTFAPAAEMAFVQGEPNQLSQLLTNLLTNAIQYTPSGHIEVRLSTDTTAKIIRIQVSDSGIGMSAEDIEHVFDRFYRGSNVGQSTLHGIGLGLSIAREIVNLHHGTIRVESELGVGTTFTVELPLESLLSPDPAAPLPQQA
jgi:signal transduction histidine kinase